jgi:ribosomal protein RSM22 (predicted rRNA methylase)
MWGRRFRLPVTLSCEFVRVLTSPSTSTRIDTRICEEVPVHDGSVQLPDHVRRMIEERAEAVGFPALRRAASAMSQAYREDRAVRLPDEERAAAYLVTRMPATFAAAHAVLRELRERLGTRPISSMLDIGAGTGAASLAARQCFPEVQTITMVERDSALAGAALQWLPEAAVILEDVARIKTLPPHDLVLAAYSLDEIGKPLAARLWQAARVALVAIEPGTPRGYSLVLRVRQELLESGAHMVAPCPAAAPCPLSVPDWCHFAARVERSSIHRRIKDAELGYEDEKFSYVALAREPVQLAASRIIRRPRQRPGLIVLETCAPAGVRTVRVPRRDRAAFRAARQAPWGAAWGY